MPRAADMPADIRDAVHNVRATTNPLGVKGVGEAGTTASIAAVMNAVADALPGGAGAHLDMPVTAMKLWEACRQAKQSRAGDEVQSMIRKSGNRFSEKIMLHQ
jgi:carbon-monoxide dehydrogenase large subunit